MTPLQTIVEYQAALHRTELLADAVPGSADDQEYDALTDVIVDYEILHVNCVDRISSLITRSNTNALRMAETV